MTRVIVICFHKYTPYGSEFYEPMLDFFLTQMKKFEDEYDHIYFVDSNWEIDPEKIKNLKATILRVNPSLRYYDAYKEVLPQIKEDQILFLDNDSTIYRRGVIDGIFKKLEEGYHVVSIYDTIGKTFEELGGKSKFCPYLFAMPRILLNRYTDYEWGPNMPEYETLGELTKALIQSGAGYKFYEFPEDKNSIYFDGHQDEEHSKDTGFYHIRAGSTSAVLLAWKENAPDTYWEYLKNQPKSEYLRQFCWYGYMCNQIGWVDSKYVGFLNDIGITVDEWRDYIEKFKKYHGLV